MVVGRFFLLACFTGAAHASGIQVDVIPNFVGAGVRRYYVWPAVLWNFAPKWFAGAGAFWQRITGDGADSPIVTERGERDQFSAGLGLGYSW